MKYTESQLEQAFISLLETECYQYIHGKQVVRSSNQEVLLKDELRVFLVKRYVDFEEIELESLNITKTLDKESKCLIINM